MGDVVAIIVHTLAHRLFPDDSECLTLMVGEDRFDVFLSHNSADKPMVRRLAKKLQTRGLRVWLDESHLIPGRPWQEELESIISRVNAVAVLIGGSGVGPWEMPEMRACLQESVRRGLPVIPVLLPGAPAEPELPVFLREFTWVDLRGGLRKKGVDRLHWGITGEAPKEIAGQDQTKPVLRVLDPGAQSLSHRRLLQDLTESMASGELRDSRVAAVVLSVLKDEKYLEVATGYNPSSIVVGIRASEEWFERVYRSAGEPDWQQDFARTAAPLLRGTTHSLKRSPITQAVVVRLCNALAKRLRLKLAWPEDVQEFNDLVNRIYKVCVEAQDLEDDDLLKLLEGLVVVGPA